MKQVSTKIARDEAVILEVVRRFGPLSRVDIQKLTQLRPNTISDLVRKLVRQRRLLEAGRRSGNPLGRKQVLLRLNPDFGFILGLEFDAEWVTVSVLDLSPSVRALVRRPTAVGQGREGTLEQLLACSGEMLRQAGIEPQSLLGIGISDPGLIDSRNGISLSTSTMEFWRDVPLEQIFEKKFGVPCLLEGNARTRAMAERLLGAGELAEDMIYVDYGAGIGAGIISQGMLLRGSRDCAGEFGHMHVLEGGPPCQCGSFGCLEALASAPSVAAQARKAILEGGRSDILALAGGNAENVTGWHVLQAARSGDKLGAALVENLGECLGLGLASLVNLLNPQMIVLHRSLEVAGPALLDHIARVVRRQALRRSTELLDFRYSQFQEEGGVLGAALLILEKAFEIPALRPPQFLVDADMVYQA